MKEKSVSGKQSLPKPSKLVEKLVVGVLGLLAGTPTYIKSFLSSGSSLYPNEQSTLISSKAGEKVWIRKDYENFVTKMNNDDVVIRIFLSSILSYAELPIFGNRAIKSEHEIVDDAGKKIKKLELDDYFWTTYADIGIQIEKIASYIVNLGLDQNDKFVLFADTHSEWLTMFFSILRAKVTVVTVYSTLSDEAIIASVNLVEATAIFVDDKSLPRVVKMLKDMPLLTHVFLSSSCSPALIESCKASFSILPGSKIANFVKKSSVKPGRLSLKKIKKRRKSAIHEFKERFDNDTVLPKETEKVNGSSFLRKSRLSRSYVQSVSFDRNVFFDTGEDVYKTEAKDNDAPTLHLLLSVLEANVAADLPLLDEYKSDDEIIIMFTSGSTGMPKGVVLTNKNVVAASAGGSYYPLMWKDIVYGAFLPLAHVFELVCEITVCFKGGCIGYCRPLTLFTGSPMLADEQIGDFSALGPTISPLVPLVLERLNKTILEKVKDAGGVAPSLLGYALDNKKYYLDKGVNNTLLEKIVFKKIRQNLGSRLKYCICGGAPLISSTEEFSRIVIGAKLKQGYGLTETCAGGSLGNFSDASVGNTGPPFPGVKFKLVEWVEGDYSPYDDPNPRGEVHISGDNVAVGYYNMRDLTDEAFYVDEETNERWFKTGDIAEYLPNGTFKIIDRKKDIVKLRNGEYVSLVAVEKAASRSEYVDNLCALPNSQSEFITLIVSVFKPAVDKLAKSLNLSNTEFTSTVKNYECSKIIFENIMTVCKSSKLNKNELPGQIHLSADSWTPETGLVTPTMKVKRHEIAKFFSDLL